MVWERWNEKDGRREHNHIRDGYAESDVVPPSQNETRRKAWANLKWKKTKACLDGITIVVP